MVLFRPPRTPRPPCLSSLLSWFSCHIACDTVGVALVAVVPVVSTMRTLARNVASIVLLPWFFVFCVAHLDFARSPSFACRYHGHSTMIVHFHHGFHHTACDTMDLRPWCSYVVILFHLSATHGVSAVFLHRGSSTRRAQPYYGPMCHRCSSDETPTSIALLDGCFCYHWAHPPTPAPGCFLQLQRSDVVAPRLDKRHDRCLLGLYQVFPLLPAYHGVLSAISSLPHSTTTQKPPTERTKDK